MSIRVPSIGFAGIKAWNFLTLFSTRLTQQWYSDLYLWREIFQLYVEAEVFESVSEADRGERPVEEIERRAKLFVERVTQRGLGDGRQLKLKESRVVLETFLELNIFILGLKKVSAR
jgi:hypothetical protein